MQGVSTMEKQNPQSSNPFPEIYSPFPDTNDNGIPDYKEPWLYRFTFKLLVREIKKHPHTLLARAIKTLEDLAAELRGAK
jgi:hypothetical protein